MRQRLPVLLVEQQPDRQMERAMPDAPQVIE
jgi:hypothetical protein